MGDEEPVSQQPPADEEQDQTQQDQTTEESGTDQEEPDKPGTTVYFPAIQVCAKGETRWIEVPAQGQSAEDLKRPAPSLTLGPKQAGGN